jgi:ligand-binding sensor domain-containing protein
MEFQHGKISARIAVAVALFGLPWTVSAASEFEWRSLTGYGGAGRMAVIHDTLFVATSGGLLAVTSPDLSGRQYTNLDGLGTVDLTDVMEAADGAVWLSGDGLLIRWKSPNTVRYPIVDNDGKPFRLTRLVEEGDYLWVGSDAGLILFSKSVDGGQIQDAFQLFADLNPAPEIYDVLLTNDSIWLATSSGLAVADRTSHLALKSPANWKGYSRSGYPELGNDTIFSVESFDGDIYAGSADGLYRLDQIADTLVKLPFPATSAVYQLIAETDSMFVYSHVGRGAVVGGAAFGLATPAGRSVRTGIVYHGVRWIGTADWGILFENPSGGFEEYSFTGLPHNNVAGVAFSPDGLMATLFYSRGLWELRSGEWLRRAVNVASRGTAIQCGHDGTFYVGTFGAGMWRVGDTVTQFNALNSTLQEAGGIGSNYVVCYDVAVTENHFFGVNFEPRDGTRVAIARLNGMDALSGWTALGVSDGLVGEQMVSIDTYGQAFAIGSGLNGAYYYYYGADPFDKSDDTLVHYYQTQPNFRYRIISNTVRVVRFSPEGELWVGTNFGISRFDVGFESFVDVLLPAGFGPDITAIEFDSRGNAWIGAKNGLARIDGFSGDISVYTPSNSGLIDEYVNNLTFDSLTGNLYVATPSGISVVLSTIGPPTNNVEEAYAFPNPYIVGSPDDLLNFNFSGIARLRVFTVAGELVAERPEPVWDGRNDGGEAVASGVYLFVLTDSDGNVGRGKFLLVRE